MRSSLRARNSPPNPQQSNSSSSSSLSSARPERSTRSHHKSSPRKSNSPASLSDNDPPSPQPMEEPPLTRRSTRHAADDDDDNNNNNNNNNNNHNNNHNNSTNNNTNTNISSHNDNDVAIHDDESEPEVPEAEDDVTRCICGHQDYPGPPSTDPSSPITYPASEDAGGLFIQCDKCHVWQHGGCVGIMDESKSPENYFCELCDKKLHNVMTDSKGQRYSHYLPLYPNDVKTARKPSMSKDSDAKSRKDRESASRASVESTTAKRRSTMNSRQTYDEEETLRRVIEESRGQNDTVPSISAQRKGKRSRDESEETKQEIKRQRTNSDSPDPPSTMHTASLNAESDDENGSSRIGGSTSKRVRNAAGEGQRQKEQRERERQREQQRAEAAGRRKERAGRRRGEDSEAVDDTPRPHSTSIPPTSQPPSPPPAPPPQLPSSSHKKGAKGKQQKRLGRNQYTKDRDLGPKGAASPHLSKPQSQPYNSSGEEQTLTGNGDSNSATNSKGSPNHTMDPIGPAKGKAGKAKGKIGRHQAGDADTPKDREKEGITLNDLKKRAGMMAEYITKAQVDMAAERTPTNGFVTEGGAVQPPDVPTDRDFKELNSREMMDVLTRQIMTWQKEYGNFGSGTVV